VIYFTISCYGFAQNSTLFLDWVKYNNNGLSWGYSVCTDLYENVYSAGIFQDTIFFETSSGSDTIIQDTGTDHCFIQKIDNNGEILWLKSLKSDLSVSVNSMVTDSLGNLYLLGQFGGSTDFNPDEDVTSITTLGTSEVFILKLNPNGSLVWIKTLVGEAGSQTSGTCINIDLDGHLVIAGEIYGTSDLDPGVLTNSYSTPTETHTFIEKLDTAGNLIWTRIIEASSPNALEIDPDNNLYLVGSFIGDTDFDPSGNQVIKTSASLGYYDAYTLKLNSNGDFMWVNAIGGLYGDLGVDVCVDSLGNVYTVGRFRSTVDFDPSIDTFEITAVGFDNSFVLKTDSVGVFKWVKSIESAPSGSHYNHAKSATISPQNNILVFGDFDGTVNINYGTGSIPISTNGNTDLFVQTFDTSGNCINGAVLGGVWYDVSNAICTGSNEEILITGRIFGNVNFNPYGNSLFSNCSVNTYFVAKFDVGFLSIQPTLESNKFIVYPNPTSVDLYFNGISFNNAEMVVYSIDGKEVMRQKIQDQPKIDVSLLQSGSYVIQILSDDEVYTAKFIKD
jgi:hypothetical protein